MLKRKVPFYLLIVTVLVSVSVSFLLFSHPGNSTPHTSASPVYQAQCLYTVKRLSGFDYVHPLMYAEPECESPSLLAVKNDVEKIISSHTASGDMMSASVYIRKYSGGSWTSVGDGLRYQPGSLLKVPILMAFCKMKEKDPELFGRKIMYNKKITVEKLVSFPSQSIELGKSYTVRELLHYMITFSDNAATLLLKQNMNKEIFDKIFYDLGMDVPNSGKGPYTITAKQYSEFFKILYNAAYLSSEDSEYCLELLSTCTFSDGMLSGLPPNCKVAHKFGESGSDKLFCLSESGIIYSDNGNYILTVMTNGSDVHKLPAVIGEISKVVFEGLNSSTGSI